jgi:hypothetical protein
VDCVYVPNQPLTLHLHRDSSPWVVYLQILFTKQPTVAVELGGVRGRHDLYGRWVLELHDLVWRSRGYSVRITTADGAVSVFAVIIS